MANKLPEIGKRYKHPDSTIIVEVVYMNESCSELVVSTKTNHLLIFQKNSFLSYYKEIPEQEPVKPTSEWQPIETCPKPSGRVLLWSEGFRSASYGHWYSTYKRFEYDGYDWGNPDEQPTHWMPLPKPPIK